MKNLSGYIYNICFYNNTGAVELYGRKGNKAIFNKILIGKQFFYFWNIEIFNTFELKIIDFIIEF